MTTGIAVLLVVVPLALLVAFAAGICVGAWLAPVAEYLRMSESELVPLALDAALLRSPGTCLGTYGQPQQAPGGSGSRGGSAPARNGDRLMDERQARAL